MHRCLIALAIIALAATPASAKTAVDHMLPKNFSFALSGAPRPVPIWNWYRGPHGGYVACYSHRSSGAVYPVGGDIYVMGVVRLQGDYEGRIFQPLGYRDRDISAADQLKGICQKSIRACFAGGCWAGGDTGGWFGL